MVMNGVYNAEALEKLINTIHHMHNTTTPNERLFADEISTVFTRYLNKKGVHHYAINSLLYLRTLIENMKKCMKKLKCSYACMQKQQEF